MLRGGRRRFFARSPSKDGAQGMNRKPIVVVGSINIDLVARAERIPLTGETVHSNDFQKHPGGKGANQAVAVARLGYPVRMVGNLGSDAFGEELRAELVRSGVDARSVQILNGPSGVAMIAVAPNGDNAIVVTPGANALLSPKDVDDNVDAISKAGVVLTQLEIPLETVLHLGKLCVRMGVPLILDPAPARALPADLLRCVSWLTPNETEIGCSIPEISRPLNSQESSEIVDALLKHCRNGVVLKMGSRGSYVATKEGFRQHVNAFHVTAVDTTAAGDAFNGAFAVGLMLGKSPLESAQFAAAAGAVSVTRPGAQPSMPTMNEVNLMLTGGARTDLGAPKKKSH
jgi:ribokinase